MKMGVPQSQCNENAMWIESDRRVYYEGDIIMNTIIKSCNGISVAPIESQLLCDRKLFIEGPITVASACEFVKTIMFLVKADANAPIDVYINSTGGKIYGAGLLIYDTLKGIETEINYHCFEAASMAALILAGGKKGHRFILQHSRTMIHEPLMEGEGGGSASEIKRRAEDIMKIKQLEIDLLSADTGKTREEIGAAILYDNYMNAEESIAFGLCDAIEPSVV